MAFFFSLFIVLVYIIDRIETFLKWLNTEYTRNNNNYSRKQRRKKKSMKKETGRR